LLWPSEGEGCTFADRRFKLNGSTRGLDNFFDNAQSNTCTIRTLFRVDGLENRKDLVMVLWSNSRTIIGDNKSIGITTFFARNMNAAVGMVMVLDAIAN
jgi:hypothetical protein